MRVTNKSVGLVLATMALSACTSIKSPGLPSHPWLGQKAPCAQDACTQGEAAHALAVAQSYCTEVREFHQRGGQITGSQRLFVGVLGSLAGSVFAVTAVGSASKAWAGLSGATNGIQTQIDQAAERPGGPDVIESVSNAQLAFADEVKPLLASKNWAGVVSTALLAPDRCGAAAGLGLAKGRSIAAAAAAAAAGADKAASAAMMAASSADTAASAAQKASASK